MALTCKSNLRDFKEALYVFIHNALQGKEISDRLDILVATG